MDERDVTASTGEETIRLNDDTNTTLNYDETGTFPNTSLPSTSEVTGADFVTIEEVKESFKEKNKNDFSSINDDCISETGKFDSSLNAIMEKKDLLINSLRNVLGDSSVINVNEDRMNSSVVSVVSDSGNPECRPNIETSTPFPEVKPLAARFLKNWTPFDEIDEIDVYDENGYEKAMASLKEVLSDTSIDTTSQLDSYSSMLDAFKEEDDKKFDEMISSITFENDNIKELETVTKDVNEFLEKCSKRNDGFELSSSLNDTVIESDSKNCTLVARDEVITINDTETTIKDIPNTPAIFTIDSSHSEIDDTIVLSETSIIPETPAEPIKSDIPNNQKLAELSKENDLEILIIEGDEDIDINADDEDLLLASDDEAKLDKSENKKVNPQIPLVKDLEVFISNDPDENRDNNDPKWDYLRNLGTDYDRYLAVRSRWKNIQIPNPKKDLTCRCRNPDAQLNGHSANYNNNHISNNINNNGAPGKRLHSPENQYRFAKKPRRDTCTIVFDQSIRRLAQHVQEERQAIFNDQEQALQQLADEQHMESIYMKQKGGTLMDMKRLQYNHMMTKIRCIEDFRGKLEALQERERSNLIALKKASEEVQQFHEFYPNEDEKNGDTKSLVYLTDTEVQEILEVEEMLLSFYRIYNE